MTLPALSNGLQKGEPGGKMKGWPANHSEDSFARVRLGQGPALPLAEPFLQAVVL